MVGILTTLLLRGFIELQVWRANVALTSATLEYPLWESMDIKKDPSATTREVLAEAQNLTVNVISPVLYMLSAVSSFSRC